MDHQDFMAARSDFDIHCEAVLEAKKEEYSREGSDRLNQFKRAGCLKEQSSVEALAGMMVKHETSIHDMTKAITAGKHFDRKKWQEKLGDLRNYCDLLWALLIDEGEI